MDIKRIFIESKRDLKAVPLMNIGRGNIAISRMPSSSSLQSISKDLLNLIMNDLSNMEFDDVISLNLSRGSTDAFNLLGGDEVDITSVPIIKALVELQKSNGCIHLQYILVRDFDTVSRDYLKVDSQTVIRCHLLI